ncbi:DUF6531 domain-containing protein [Burkholderia sp. AU33545]|uniref:RHS repeat-associated core domain-containing protein n=1 Tax=Burkholderia sp. AU33545 TaxID=2879631 RepID=UPI001CF3FC6E|nr:RHS repeat-associated core domain-containing protein [Burkholderia sp. AU33545]MCA8202143.1 DUF6531 domain-containing protein [Burkholderia sp. AU33545]
MALPAVKHLDPVVGVDVHSVLVTPGTPPVFLPHPHVGFMLDKREYIQAAKAVVGCIAMMIVQEKVTEYIEDHPEDVTKLEHLADEATQQVNELMGGGKLPDFKNDPTVAEGTRLAKEANKIKNRISDDLGSNVGSGGSSGRPIFVNGMMRATAGTHAYHVPGLHFPLGESFAPPDKVEPSNDGESFMGSKTVLANNDPMSYMALEALSCWSVGMEPPPHNSAHTDRTYPSMPSSVMLPIPAGRPVLVGGPPIMNMAAAAKGLFKAFRGSKWAKALADKLNLKPGFLKCNVLHAEPVDVTTGEVIVSHHDFKVAGHLPLEWNRRYASSEQRLGIVGVGWRTPADIQLNLISRDDGIGAAIYFVDHATAFDEVPRHDGWSTRTYDWQYGYALYSRDNQLVLRTGECIEYGFSLPQSWDAVVGSLSNTPALTLMLDWIGDLHGHAWLFDRKPSGQLSRVVEHDLDGPTGRYIECESSLASHNTLTTSMTLIDADKHAYPLAGYEQDRELNLVKALDAMRNSCRFDYEGGNRITRQMSARGVSFHYSYRQGSDGVRRVDRAWGDDGVLDYRFEYDLDRYETRIIDSMGHVAIIQMNGRHVPIAEIDVLGGITSYGYDAQGRTSIETDQIGRTSRWEYDVHGNLIAQFMPDGRAIRAEYDANHKPLCVTAPGGRQWRYVWDSRGRLRSYVAPSQTISRYEYDSHGRITSWTGPNGDATAFGYDHHGNLASIIDALGNATRYEHDARGSVVRTIDATGHENRYERDPCGRLVRVIESDGRETHCAYDADGNLIRYRDPVGNVTCLTYTTLGEIAKRTQPDGTEVSYYYDTEGQLVDVVNERGERYRIKRDALGRIVEEIDYWGQSRLYEYGSTGELLRSVNPLGQTIHYRYDRVGRIVEKRIPDPDQPNGFHADCFHYNEHGDLVRASNPSAILQFSYDADGRLIEERQGDDFRLFNRYDAAGNRVERKTHLVSGDKLVEQSILYGYDALNAVVRIEIDGHAPIVIQRDALGQIRDERLGDGLRREMSYEARGRLSRQALLVDTGEMFAIEYAYNANGDLIERRDSRSGIERFQYDSGGNIVEHIDPAGTVRRFLYDPAGDLLRTRNFLTGTTQNSSTSRTWLREGRHGDSLYVFDRAGNLTHKQDAEQDVELRWDAAGQLTESLATRHAGKGNRRHDYRIRVRYEYDAFQRRTRKIISTLRHKVSRARVHRFFWDGDMLASELRFDVETADQITSEAEQAAHQLTRAQPGMLNAPTRHGVRDWIYYPNTFRPLAMVHRNFNAEIGRTARQHEDPSEADGPLPKHPRPPALVPDYATQMDTDDRSLSYHLRSTVYFFHNDPNGAPVRLVDEQGDVAWEASYATWTSHIGKDRSNLDQPIRLQGQYYDEETGLCYNRYRYFDHEIGQFISQDPSRIDGGPSLYQYAPNPASWVDPYGLANTIDGQGNTVPIVALGIPDRTLFKPKSGITTPYSRNSKCGPTPAQTRAVQGKPCAECGQTKPKMIADHIDALVVEYYRTGANDVSAQSSVAAVQPHCPSCSPSQGGKASAFSKAMNKILGI